MDTNHPEDKVPAGWKKGAMGDADFWSAIYFKVSEDGAHVSAEDFWAVVQYMELKRRGGYYVSSQFIIPRKREIGPFKELHQACSMAELIVASGSLPVGWERP
jgi:hypothetical protein